MRDPDFITTRSPEETSRARVAPWESSNGISNAASGFAKANNSAAKSATFIVSLTPLPYFVPTLFPWIQLSP
jgi:hypothetical protein